MEEELKRDKCWYVQFRVSSGQLKVETTRGIEDWQCSRVMWERSERCNVPIENTLHATRLPARSALTASAKVVRSTAMCHAPHMCYVHDRATQVSKRQVNYSKPTMSNDSAAPNPAAISQQTYRQIAATHIAELSKLSSSLPDILTFVAAALSQLTNHPIPSESREDSSSVRDSDLRQFSFAIKTLVGLFRDALVAQINDLERYKVIPATLPRYTPLPGAARGVEVPEQQEQEPPKHDPDAGVKNGGYGNFDVGVLNAQVSTALVGDEHALDRVRALLDDLLERSGREGESMVVDG